MALAWLFILPKAPTRVSLSQKTATFARWPFVTQGGHIGICPYTLRSSLALVHNTADTGVACEFRPADDYSNLCNCLPKLTMDHR